MNAIGEVYLPDMLGQRLRQGAKIGLLQQSTGNVEQSVIDRIVGGCIRHAFYPEYPEK